MTRFLSFARIICVLAVRSAAALQAGGIFPVNLECDAWQNPLGIDDPNPRLSWQVVATNTTERSQSQTGYEIQVASSAALLASNEPDLWDSGHVSGQPFFVTYGGSALASVQQVFWQVRVWDANGIASGYSSVATWTMGLLNPMDWQGNWLVPPASINSGMPIFLRQFKVNPGLQRALVYICGLGQYELSANGAKVGNALLAPGWSLYPETCLYDTLDLTSQLTNGNNALGVMLGNGMYNVSATTNYTKFTGSFGPPKLMAQIYLFYTNGTSQVIASDTNWVTTNGPIIYSHVYGGEYYDARLWPAGWNQAGFAAAGWPAAVTTSGPGGTLRGESHAAPPMVAMQTLLPIHTNILAANSLVYDLGQNATIIASLTTHGPAGSQIVITPAELTNADGTINRESCGGGTASWQYTLAGTGSESWSSRFFYHGGRYLQVTLNPAAGSSQLPSLDVVSGVVIQGASTNTGNFSCSFPLFNQIRTMIRWSQANNLASILTDCPHRERLGWQGQSHENGPAFRYEYDMRRMVAKAMQDMADSQTRAGTGLVPNIAPEVTVFGGGFRDTPEIGSSVIQYPWQQYLFTGDDTLLRAYYTTMTNYFQYLNSQAVNYFLNYPNGLGDWYDLGPQPEGASQDTPVSLTADFFYCLDAQTLAQAAAELGKAEDAAYFSQLATNIGTAFNQTYYSNGSYATGSETSQAMPLYLGIVNPTNQAAVMTSLIANINSQGITTGEVGHRYLLRALTDNGRPDMVYALHSGTDNPGYGYMLSQGATALTEAWNANPSDSQDHFMLGQITEWFYHDLAGIQWDPSVPGFRNVIIKPAFVGGITWVNADYNSARGPIVSDWAITNNRAMLNVTIPVGSTGSIFLPLYGAATTNVLITESGTSIWRNGGVSGSSPGVTFTQVQTNHGQTYVVWAVASGNYQFGWNVLLPPPPTPTGLTATAGNAEVVLAWNASTGATNYIVQRSTGGSYTTIASPATANYADTAVTNGTTYYYEVAAADAYGAGTNSSWVSATPSVSAGNQTIQLDFSPTYLAYGTQAASPANGAVTINGSSLIAGNVLVCDVLVSNTSGTTGDNWGSVNLNPGGFFGVTGAKLGVLVRTGTGADQCLVYTNGVQGANFPGTAEVNSNHLRLTLYVAATGSTTNMGWLAQLDQGLTGSFTSALAGTNLTFSGNSISLTFSAYQAAVSFVQSPIPVNTSLPTLLWQVAGGQIQFGWPTDHTGWRLQAQTNAPNAGLGGNWVTVSGSTLTNQIKLPVSPANGSVFYRLVYP
jgi:hypothetical protein